MDGRSASSRTAGDPDCDVCAASGRVPQGDGDESPSAASWYVYFFQLPLIPEAYLLGRGGRGMTWLIGDYAGQSREALERDARGMAEPGAMTAALHWYRAVPFMNRRDVAKKITVPTMFIWSDGDVAIKDKGVRDCGKYVSAEYRFETLHGTHWMVDEQPDAVADLLVDWLAAHPNLAETPSHNEAGSAPHLGSIPDHPAIPARPRSCLYGRLSGGPSPASG